ncbi:hypothetical protein GTY65_28740 [Streptomyces sp. SID8379]|nr:hypothetical protein [Streptomyces sp. SID8379]MYW68031.1 hypothetical protein [Streptomyces sp. SID8379]
MPQARQPREGVVLPADGSEPLLPGTFGDRTGPAAPAGPGGPAGPAGASPWGQPWGPESQQAQAAQPMPTYEWGQAAAQQPVAPPQEAAGALPPQAPSHALPQQHAPAGPMPPASAYDSDATQYIPPQAAGALPPEMPAESTQFLGRAVQQQGMQQHGMPPQGMQQHGMPPQQPMPGAMPGAMPAGPDSQATQYIPPVPAQPQGAPYDIRPGAPGDRQPPAEFDALFRTEPNDGGAGATQQMPRFDPHAQAPHAQAPYTPPAQQQTYAQQEPEYEPAAPRRKSRTGIIAAVGVGVLVVGVGVGALLSGGGDDDSKSDSTTTVSDSSSAPSGSPSPAVDPAKQQAVALDKLLAESNNSRSAVVRSVANIGSCKELPTAAKDLRSAATQRNDLVTQLSALSVDKLPNHAQLTAALTAAWKASASADSHYAAWADQVAGNKKLCHKGRAKATPQRRAGDTSSQTASQQKAQASKLWNGIASQYGLTQRSAVQL